MDKIPDWIDYYHFPGAIRYQKLKQILDLVGTRYVVEIPDDDFVTHSAIDTCVNFLEQNDSYVAAKGQTIRFSEDSYEVQHYHRSKRFVNDIINDYSGDIEGRLTYLFKNFWYLHHAVTRTEVFQEYCDVVNNNKKLWPISYEEKIMGFIYAVRGNYKVLPMLYMVRSNSRMLVTNKEIYSDLSPDIPLSEIINVLKNDADNPLVTLLSDALGVSYEDARVKCIKLFRMVVKRSWIVDRYHKIFRLILASVYKSNMLPSKNWCYDVDLQEVMRLVKNDGNSVDL